MSIKAKAAKPERLAVIQMEVAPVETIAIFTAGQDAPNKKTAENKSIKLDFISFFEKPTNRKLKFASFIYLY
ncbi:hypothetical protein ACFQS7_11675 [Dankookia sp. GCM10030260]|uniref:hypothetical protein n=1 Tax=Dankookia sp. GCM10030260 TaxID=3273390 RepID=UPI003609DBEE